MIRNIVLLSLSMLFTGIAFSQVKYESKLTEYNLETGSNSKFEWIDRTIYLSDDEVIVKTFGKQATDIQAWTVSKIDSSRTKDFNLKLYYTYAKNSELEFENPSVFVFYRNTEDKVEIIEWQTPIFLDDTQTLQTHRLHIN
ncbi:hypothetical protein [Christiangramia portivictoriae]|uniref:hypothetical protein n=1 Tax=Christiangramia portivictoriae TaxID=326069 RepID=UPI0004798E68|nr:hypothetical protein [Christiangramia portivictoriae]